jgi:hypothetical protein
MKRTLIKTVALMSAFVGAVYPLADAGADTHPGQSQNVVIIGGTTLDTTNNPCRGKGPEANNMFGSDTANSGGCLPVTGPLGELGDFVFTAMAPSAVTATSLAPFDTAVLNMASQTMACDSNNLPDQAKTDLINFVGGGKKLIIFDSECGALGPSDFSWLPYPFETSNLGVTEWQTLTVVEDNLLATKVGDPGCTGGDVHCIDVEHLASATDAIRDVNLVTTRDPNWCLHMSAKNVEGVTGPAQVYANFPSATDQGLIIYNGLDQDYQVGWVVPGGDLTLRKMWVQLLQHRFNPSGLQCRLRVVGVTLDPPTADNYVGENHTVTAMLHDLLGVPQAGIQVAFAVLSGPNVGATGTCSANADCTTDANGQVSFTYTGSSNTGTDVVNACFTNQNQQTICSNQVNKNWLELPNTPPQASCTEIDPPKKHAGRKRKHDDGDRRGDDDDHDRRGHDDDRDLYLLASTDAEDVTPPDLFVTNVSGSVTFGPFASGSIVQISISKKKAPRSKPGKGEVVAKIRLDSVPLVYAVDGDNVNSPQVACVSEPEPPKPPKKKRDRDEDRDG